MVCETHGFVLLDTVYNIHNNNLVNVNVIA